MTRNSLMAQDRSRIFDRCPDIEIFRLRIVGGDEEETARIFVIESRRIHKTTRTSWLERFGQLSNFESAEIIGNAHEPMFLEKIYHFLLAAFICFQERCLIGGDILGA